MKNVVFFAAVFAACGLIGGWMVAAAGFACFVLGYFVGSDAA